MENIRVEMPIGEKSKIFSSYKTIGDLKKKYPKLFFVKYIYVDPIDNRMKGTNPPNDTPIVAGAYITVAGELNDIINFARDAVNK